MFGSMAFSTRTGSSLVPNDALVTIEEVDWKEVVVLRKLKHEMDRDIMENSAKMFCPTYVIGGGKHEVQTYNRGS